MQLEKLHEFVSMLNVTIEFAEYMLQPDFVVLWRVFNPWDIEEKYDFAAIADNSQRQCNRYVSVQGHMLGLSKLENC